MNRTTISVSMALGVFASVILLGVVDGAAQQPSASQSQSDPGPAGKYVDKDGTIHLPENYRLEWVHLGSWFDEDAMHGPGSMHDVYAEPDAVKAFRSTGKWPQGATIVKEIRASRTTKMTTGQAHWDGEITQWFVMVKDNNNSFKGNESWGRGWGWALFSIDDPKTNTSDDYKVDCLGCHIPAEKTDWIYTHGYPILFETNGPFKKYMKSLYDSPVPADKPAGN